MSNLRYKCPKCKGKDNKCTQCGGHGEIDWIENVTGREKLHKGIKPGVYVKEVDICTIPAPGTNVVDLTGIQGEELKKAMKEFEGRVDSVAILDAPWVGTSTINKPAQEPTIINTEDELLKHFGEPNKTNSKVKEGPLKDGELLCKKCYGRGYTKDVDTSEEKYCDTCDGEGRVEWLDDIYKRKKKKLPFDISWDMASQFLNKSDSLYITRSVCDMAEGVAKQIAEDIDKNIMESFLNTAKKPENIRNLSSFMNISTSDDEDDEL